MRTSPMKAPSREIRRQLERENAKWPETLKPIPADQWPDLSAMKKPPIAVWRSRDFLVQEFIEGDGCRRLSVNRTTCGRDGRWDADISWDELQLIKRQVGYGNHYAVEIYPLDRDVVNVANMRHLWVLSTPLPIGWRNGGEL